MGRISRTLTGLAAAAGAVLVLATLAGGEARAQSRSGDVVHLEASFSPARAAPGDVVELRIGYTIDAGWTIYAPDHDAPTGLATTVAVKDDALEAAGKLSFPDPKVERIEVLDETHRILSGKGTFRWKQRVKADTPPGTRRVPVAVRLMACDDSRCLAPDSISVIATLEVVPAKTKRSKPAAIGLLAGSPARAGSGGGAKPRPGLDLGGGKPGLDLDGAGGGLGAAPAKVTFTATADPKRVRRGGAGAIVVGYTIAPGWHIYSPDHDYGGIGAATSIEFDTEHLRLAGPAVHPPPRVKRHPDGTERTLDGSGTIRFPFVVAPDAPPGELTAGVTVRYQACTDLTCDPPAEATARVELVISDEPPLEGAPAGVPPAAAADGGGGNDAPVDEGGGDGGFLLFLLSAVGWGLFTLLMPCTYPMIPITISYFTKQAERDRTGVVPLALAYGAGIVLDFVVIGAFVGPVIVVFATHWITNVILGLLFVVFALSLFGLFEIRLPSSLLGLSTVGSQRGGVAGVFLLGATLVITSFTCTAPFVGALLATGAQARSMPAIVSGMAVFGLTMALPFVGLALFPGMVQKMPRSGAWMNTVKITLGFVELAASLKFFSNAEYALQLMILPRGLFLLLWAALAALTWMYLLGLVPLKERVASISPLRFVFALLFLLFAAYCYHGSTGHRLDRIMTAIVPPYPPVAEAAEGGTGDGPPWTLVENDLEAGLERARREGKLALLDWTGFT